MPKTARSLTRAALIAAVYFVLTYAMWAFGSGAIQLRLSEALCVLPLLLPEAVPGLFIGCLIANLLGGGMPLDVIFGSLTTLAAAYMTMKVGYKKPAVNQPKYWMSLVFPVLFNAVVTGAVVWYCYGFTGFGVEESHLLRYLPLTMLTVGIGELISVYAVGTVVYLGLRRLPDRLFE